MPPKLRAFSERARRHGVARALFASAMRATNRRVRLRILRAFHIEEPCAVFLECPPGLSAGFASREALRAYADDPGNDLSPKFVERALARGDQCFAIREGDALASYSWYSVRPTSVDLPGLALHFQPGWVYMYKAFTHPLYRGRRLYSHGVSLALQHYRARGMLGLVAYVESTNFDSLRSSRRTGLRPFGSIAVVGSAVLRTPGCERLDFRLEPSMA